VVHIAVEAIMPGLGIEPQQMIAQERQFLVLTQGSHIAKTGPRTERVFVWHFKLLLEGPRGGVESLDPRYCALHNGIQVRILPQIAADTGTVNRGSAAVRAPSGSG